MGSILRTTPTSAPSHMWLYRWRSFPWECDCLLAVQPEG